MYWEIIKKKEVMISESEWGQDVIHLREKVCRLIHFSDTRFRFIQGDIITDLQFVNDSFDLVYSCNLLECIPDKQRLINEVGRVLKPGGQVVFCHYDWDSQIFNGYDK